MGIAWRLAKLSFFLIPQSQNTNVYHMVVQCSQMFVNIKHSITVFNEHLFDVCKGSSKCEKRFCLAGPRFKIAIFRAFYFPEDPLILTSLLMINTEYVPKTYWSSFDIFGALDNVPFSTLSKASLKLCMIFILLFEKLKNIQISCPLTWKWQSEYVH